MTAHDTFAAHAAPMLTNDDYSRAWWDLNDAGNAKRFRARHGDRFLCIRGQGWVVYDGKCWSREEAKARIYLACLETANAIKDEAKALWDAADRAAKREIEAAASAEGETPKRPAISSSKLRERAIEVRDYAEASGNSGKLKGMLTILEPQLECALEDFDREPYALNVQNGTLRFIKSLSGEWRVRLDRHDSADKITRICAFDYKPDAPSGLWDGHLARTVPAYAERAFLLRTLGYCALGLMNEQVFFIWQGRGGDGKSVTSNVMRRVLNTYAAKVDVKTFLEDRTGRSGAQASPDIARLAGAVRMVTASEPPKGSRLNEALVKDITGGAPLVARHLNKDPFEFSPRFRIIIDCNPLPGIGGADDGIWRRTVLIPFREQLLKAEMDSGLEEKLVGQGEGVLASVVNGALDYLERGLMAPPSIDEAVAGYKSESSPFRDWLDTFCLLEPGVETMHKTLYGAYKTEMERLGMEQPMSSISFGKALTEKQISKRRQGGSGDIVRVGIKLLTESERAARAAAASGPEAITSPADASRDGDERVGFDPPDQREWST